ncbi:hypothetical protein ACE01N_20065 [Saccharicrinis sp. FJH2]|uniref:hypothetical protein n=1 Tax=Saccharicrinis sp. FJH65 TaxID=3344659 RepID=UPI0035F3F55A
MNRVIFILIILTFGIRVYGQVDSLISEIIIGEYSIGTKEYEQIDITYTNPTERPFILTIDDKNLNESSDIKKLQNYFNRVRGDFSLTNLIYEDLLDNKTPILYSTFYKIIKPGKTFTISVIKYKGKLNNVIDCLTKQIIIVDSSGFGVPIMDLENYEYKHSIISLNANDIMKCKE